jgi:hypothetical protein
VSTSSGLVAISDTAASVGPSSCMSKVCLFEAKRGTRVRDWNTEKPPTELDLATYLAPLETRLREDAFQSMTKIYPKEIDHGVAAATPKVSIEFKSSRSGAAIKVRGKGKSQFTYRFKTRVLRCDNRANRPVPPQSVRAWSNQNASVLALAVDYFGEEGGCSWTQWIVIPLKLN